VATQAAATPLALFGVVPLFPSGLGALADMGFDSSTPDGTPLKGLPSPPRFFRGLFPYLGCCPLWAGPPMRLLNLDPILGLLNSYLVDSAQLSSISYTWNLDSLLVACLAVQAFIRVLLAALAALLLLPVADTGQTRFAFLRPLTRFGFWGYAASFGLLLYLAAYLAVNLLWFSAFFTVSYPLSCLWGVGLAGKLLIKELRRFYHPKTLAQATALSSLAKVTVDTFLGHLPAELSGHLRYNRGSRLEAPAGGSRSLPAPASPSLGLNLWTLDGFRRDTGLRLHAAAFVSLLLSAPGLLLHFLASLPWEVLPEGRVRLSLLFAYAPLALVLELLFSYAGLSSIRFTVNGRRRLTLVLRLDELLAVARLGAESRSEWACSSPRALSKFLRYEGATRQGYIEGKFFLPLGSERFRRTFRVSMKRRG
jgi:hypothetical protein